MIDIAALPIFEEGDHYLLSFEVPADAPCLNGHFPEDPLVPAAQLLAWLQIAVARVDPRLETSGRFDRAKFLAPVRAESLLTLEWQTAGEGWSVLARVGATVALRANLSPDPVNVT